MAMTKVADPVREARRRARWLETAAKHATAAAHALDAAAIDAPHGADHELRARSRDLFAHAAAVDLEASRLRALERVSRSAISAPA